VSFTLAVCSDPMQKDEINKKAFEKFRKEHTAVPPTLDNAAPSERFDGQSALQDQQVECTAGVFSPTAGVCSPTAGVCSPIV